MVEREPVSLSQIIAETRIASLTLFLYASWFPNQMFNMRSAGHEWWTEYKNCKTGIARNL